MKKQTKQYRYRARSVAQVVENRVVAVVGNSLVMPVAKGYRLDPS